MEKHESNRKMNTKINTIIVDDNKDFRAALKIVCELFNEIEIIQEFDNGQAFINSLPQPGPALVFMDVEMPLLNGIEATRIASKQYPQLTIIGLSMQNEKEYKQQLLSAGATNYLNKNELNHKHIEQIIKNLTL